MSRVMRAHVQVGNIQLLVLQEKDDRLAPYIVTSGGAVHHRCRAIQCADANVVLDVIRMVREGRSDLPAGAEPYTFICKEEEDGDEA